jgi:DNA-binding transcriptional ArsR family regulator
MANNTYRALAHPIRRGIIERLAQGPATVGQATRQFGVSKPTLSRHLKVLEEAGVVVRVVDGRTHRLRLDVRPLDEATAWLDVQRSRWRQMFEVADDFVAEKREER